MELLVIVAIVSILALLTYPNYVRTKVQVHRSDAQSEIMATEAIVERYLVENNKQNIDSSDMALSQFSNYDPSSSTPVLTDEGYYRITIIPDSTGYKIIGTATVDNTLTSCDSSANSKIKQCGDNLCRKIVLDHGVRKSEDNLGAVANENTTQCW